MKTKEFKERCPVCKCPVTVRGEGSTHWYQRPGPKKIEKVVQGWAIDYTQMRMGSTRLMKLITRIAELYGFTAKDL